MEKQKLQFWTVILTSGEEYENYTHTFQTKPILWMTEGGRERREER